MSTTTNGEECCPKFNPEPWDEQEFHWQNKPFIKDTVRSIFYIPLNMGSVIKRMWKKVQNSGKKSDDFLLLSKDVSPWKSEQYLSVPGTIPNAENVEFSGNYLTKVFEGPYKDARKWVKEMEEYAESEGKTVKDLYFYYTTCPKCAKKYGKN